MRCALSIRKEAAGNLLDFSKGIAILLIAFHHFSRSLWLVRGVEPPTLLQWNFDPAGEGFGSLVSAATAGQYSEVIFRLSAQFGYVGVHLFVLMSGLGLALGTPKAVDTGSFLKRRFRKIIPPFWTAVVFFVLLRIAIGEPYSVRQVVERMSLLTTFDQEQFFRVDPPLWCLALFFQLYLIFLPLRRLIVRFGSRMLLPLTGIAFIARWALSFPPIQHWNMYIDHVIALDWLVVFGLGIWIGGKLQSDGEVVLPAWTVTGTMLTATVLLFLSERFTSVYPIHDTAVGIVIGGITLLAWKAMPKLRLTGALAAVGSVSFPLYLYHRPLIGMAVLLWRESPQAASVPPLGLGLATVGTLVVVFLLVRLISHLNRGIVTLAFGI